MAGPSTRMKNLQQQQLLEEEKHEQDLVHDSIRPLSSFEREKKLQNQYARIRQETQQNILTNWNPLVAQSNLQLNKSRQLRQDIQHSSLLRKNQPGILFSLNQTNAFRMRNDTLVLQNMDRVLSAFRLMSSSSSSSSTSSSSSSDPTRGKRGLINYFDGPPARPLQSTTRLQENQSMVTTATKMEEQQTVWDDLTSQYLAPHTIVSITTANSGPLVVKPLDLAYYQQWEQQFQQVLQRQQLKQTWKFKTRFKVVCYSVAALAGVSLLGVVVAPSQVLNFIETSFQSMNPDAQTYVTRALDFLFGPKDAQTKQRTSARMKSLDGVVFLFRYVVPLLSGGPLLMVSQLLAKDVQIHMSIMGYLQPKLQNELVTQVAVSALKSIAGKVLDFQLNYKDPDILQREMVEKQTLERLKQDREFEQLQREIMREIEELGSIEVVAEQRTLRSTRQKLNEKKRLEEQKEINEANTWHSKLLHFLRRGGRFSKNIIGYLKALKAKQVVQFVLTASLATALVSVLSYWLESNPLQALTTLNNLALSFAGNRELLAGVAAMGIRTYIWPLIANYVVVYLASSTKTVLRFVDNKIFGSNLDKLKDKNLLNNSVVNWIRKSAEQHYQREFQWNLTVAFAMEWLFQTTSTVALNKWAGDNITPKLLEKAYLSFDKHTCGRIYQRLTVSLEQTLTKIFIVDRGLETTQVPLAPVDVEQAFRFVSPGYLLKEWFASSTVTHMTKELRFTDPVTNAITRVHVKGVDYEEGTISIEHFSFSEYPKEEQILNATQKIIETYETTVQVVDAAKQTAEKMLLVSSPGQGTKLSSEIVGTINPVDLPSSVLPFEHLLQFKDSWRVVVKDAKEQEDRIPVDVDGQMLLQTSALFGSLPGVDRSDDAFDLQSLKSNPEVWKAITRDATVFQKAMIDVRESKKLIYERENVLRDMRLGVQLDDPNQKAIIDTYHQFQEAMNEPLPNFVSGYQHARTLIPLLQTTAKLSQQDVDLFLNDIEKEINQLDQLGAANPSYAAQLLFRFNPNNVMSPQVKSTQTKLTGFMDKIVKSNADLLKQMKDNLSFLQKQEQQIQTDLKQLDSIQEQLNADFRSYLEAIKSEGKEKQESAERLVDAYSLSTNVVDVAPLSTLSVPKQPQPTVSPGAANQLKLLPAFREQQTKALQQTRVKSWMGQSLTKEAQQQQQNNRFQPLQATQTQQQQQQQQQQSMQSTLQQKQEMTPTQVEEVLNDVQTNLASLESWVVGTKDITMAETISKWALVFSAASNGQASFAASISNINVNQFLQKSNDMMNRFKEDQKSIVEQMEKLGLGLGKCFTGKYSFDLSTGQANPPEYNMCFANAIAGSIFNTTKTLSDILSSLGGPVGYLFKTSSTVLGYSSYLSYFLKDNYKQQVTLPVQERSLSSITAYLFGEIACSAQSGSKTSFGQGSVCGSSVNKFNIRNVMLQLGTNVAKDPAIGSFVASAIQGRATLDDLRMVLEIREKNSTPEQKPIQPEEIKLGGVAEQIEDRVSQAFTTTSNLLFKLGRDGVMASVVFGDPQSSSLRKVFDIWLDTYAFQFGSKSVLANQAEFPAASGGVDGKELEQGLEKMIQ